MTTAADSVTSPMTSTARPSSPGFARLRAFMAWWRGELVGALPAAWRDRFAGRPSGLPLLLDREEVVAYAVKEGSLEESSRLPLAGLDEPARAAAAQRLLLSQGRQAEGVMLLLPPATYVRKTIELPAAAEEALHQVLAFELDRHTPFKANNAVFAARVLGRGREGANIRIDLVVAPRMAVEASVAAATLLGLNVAGVAPLMEETGWSDFDLRPVSADAAPMLSADTRLNLALFALFLLLLAAALLVPILQKRDAAIRLLPRLEAAKAESEKVQKVRNELEKLAGDANFVQGKKHAQAPVTQVVEDLARVFPDSTWVSTLEMKSGKQRELVLTGETGSATRVIELLEQMSYLKNPSFRSPLSKTPGQTAERFVIAAEIKPRPLPAMIEEGPPPVTPPSPVTSQPVGPPPAVVTQPATVAPPAATPTPVAPAAPQPIPPKAPAPANDGKVKP